VLLKLYIFKIYLILTLIIISIIPQHQQKFLYIFREKMFFTNKLNFGIASINCFNNFFPRSKRYLRNTKKTAFPIITFATSHNTFWTILKMNTLYFRLKRQVYTTKNKIWVFQNVLYYNFMTSFTFFNKLFAIFYMFSYVIWNLFHIFVLLLILSNRCCISFTISPTTKSP